MSAFVFDQAKVTIGDLEDFEDVTGVPLTEALKEHPVKDAENNTVRDDEGRPVTEAKFTAKTLKALVWIGSRHDNPDFSLEDARNVRVTELVLLDDEDDDPKGDVPTGD